MNTTSERYTPEQLNEAAAFHQSMIGKGTLDYAAHDVLAAMLRQAASDAAPIAELEKDAEKFRALTRCMDSVTVEFSGLSMTIKPAPKAHILLSALIQGAINATDGIDAARSRT